MTPNEKPASPTQGELAVKALEWRDWQGDGCPVPTSAFVDVRYRDGDFSRCVAAGGLPWAKTGTYCDIVAFRIVPPPNVKSAAADDIKAAYYEGFTAGCDQGEQTGKLYAEKNWPFSQAQSDHERLLMDASAVDPDLIEELREGVPIAEETANGDELYDIEAANETMAHAAHVIAALSALDRTTLPPITDSYARMAEETKRPNYSITFWRTVKGRWGARAGIGDNAFADTAEDAIDAAVTNAIAAQGKRT